ncbi:MULTISPECIES: iron chelate uptake ABC transporter family permease subunit [Gulosibacter]|uniref:iron chelate uptake ABC transporter family permease subunit n=1 Tax=Gulosibacter TaxID=256818 RepID=UPI000F63C6F6|nr:MULTISPECIES: iron chelate uptake ABC transporter family permease subunit [Gulosibacter]
MASTTASPTLPRQRSGSVAFQNDRARRRYWLTLGVCVTLAVLFAIGLLTYNIPVAFGSDPFWVIARRRASSVLVMLIIAVCHATATVAFQTITTNRIITPGIMGFESLYVAIQTGVMFFLGSTGLTAFSGIGQFLAQIAVMVALAALLYGWLLSGRFANLQIMLLVGIVIGTGLGSVSSFMQRMLSPSEFDLLTARLFGSVNNAREEYLPVAIPIVIVVAALLYLRSRRLNVMALGKDIATGLGLNHTRELMTTLTLVTLLMAVSTALVGPMTFLGFLVATLAYQFANTSDHRFVFPLAITFAFLVLTSAYFIMNHVFYAQGVVSILIEFVGGTVFLWTILRRRVL